MTLPYYDNTTYKNLTEVKPMVGQLYDSFTADALDQKMIEITRLRLEQIYEYEKGKGQNNQAMIQQMESIKKIFAGHVANRVGNGAWNDAALENSRENIFDAFDEAIATEASKNKMKGGN
jgi:hypothetical protein